MYRNVHKSQAAVQAVQGCVYAAVIHDWWNELDVEQGSQ